MVSGGSKVGVNKIPMQDEYEIALEGYMTLNKNHKIRWVIWVNLWRLDSAHQYWFHHERDSIWTTKECKKFGVSGGEVQNFMGQVCE